MEQDFSSQPWQYPNPLPESYQGRASSSHQLRSPPSLYHSPHLECHLPFDECRRQHPDHACRYVSVSTRLPGQNQCRNQVCREEPQHDQSHRAFMDPRAMTASTYPRPLNSYPTYRNAPLASDGSGNNFDVPPAEIPISIFNEIDGLGYSSMPGVQTVPPAHDIQARHLVQDHRFDPSMLGPNGQAMFGLQNSAGDTRHPSFPLSMVSESGYRPMGRLSSHVTGHNLGHPLDSVTQDRMPWDPSINAITEHFYRQADAVNPFSDAAHPPEASVIPLNSPHTGPTHSVHPHFQTKPYNQDEVAAPISQRPSIPGSGKMNKNSAIRSGPRSRVKLSHQSVESSEDTNAIAQTVSREPNTSRERAHSHGSVMLPSVTSPAEQNRPQSSHERLLEVPQASRRNPGSRAPRRKAACRRHFKKQYTPEKRKDVARKRGKVDEHCRRKKVRCEHVIDDTDSGQTPPHIKPNETQVSTVNSTFALSPSAASNLAPWTAQVSPSAYPGTPESGDPHNAASRNPRTLAPAGLHTPASTGRMTQTSQEARSPSSPYRNTVVLLPASNIASAQLGSQFEANMDFSSAWVCPDEDGQ